jgi:hypothetical protein
MAKQAPEYFYVAVKRNYEAIWRFVSEFPTRQDAENHMAERRSWTGAFNYDNAELRVISTSEAKAEFGATWQYRPIGSKGSASAAAARERKVVARRPRKLSQTED